MESLIDQSVIVEPKLDGIRCIAVLDAGQVRLYNRQLVEITSRFPEVTPHVAARNGIFDGELVCLTDAVLHGMSGTGFNTPVSSLHRADFQAIQRRANRVQDIAEAAESHPARFMPFDVISLNDANLCYLPLEERRLFLRQCEIPYTVPRLTAAQIIPGEGEGIMLKEARSQYKPGLRSPAWLKVKWEKEEWFYVGGVTTGYGKRADSFGALLVGSYEERDGNVYFKYRGEVGTGYTDEQLRDLYRFCVARRRQTNPFGDTEKLNAKFFIQPTIQIRVRFQDYTNDGRLRFPRYTADSFVHGNH